MEEITQKRFFEMQSNCGCLIGLKGDVIEFQEQETDLERQELIQRLNMPIESIQNKIEKDLLTI